MPGTLEPLTPALRAVAEEHDRYARKLDFHIIHAGGPRILAELSRFPGVRPETFRFGRATLTEYGNSAGAVVLDAPARLVRRGVGPRLPQGVDGRLRSRHHR